MKKGILCEFLFLRKFFKNNLSKLKISIYKLKKILYYIYDNILYNRGVCFGN